MSKLGYWLDYTGDECPNCGRIRVILCSSGKRICEKCHWCIEDQRYYRDEDEEEDEDDQHEFVLTVGGGNGSLTTLKEKLNSIYGVKKMEGGMEQTYIYKLLMEKWNEESYQKAMNTLSERLKSQLGLSDAVYDFYSEARDKGAQSSELRMMYSSIFTDDITTNNVISACETLYNAWGRECELSSLVCIMDPEKLSDFVLIEKAKNTESLSALFPEPEEEPGLSEAQIKKQLKYEKNPMMIKQLNIMLNKKRKERARRK